MTHQISPLGIVGMGAMGRALETFLRHDPSKVPGAILFAVKAYDLESALHEQSPLWPKEIPFVTLCNGFISNVVASVTPKMKERPIRIGMTTIGSTLDDQSKLHVYSQGSMTAWGPWQSNSARPSPRELSLLSKFPNGQWFDSIQPIIRQKWILNATLNSISAAHRLPCNKELLNYEREINSTLDEAIHLSSFLFPDVDNHIDRNSVLTLLNRVIDATAENENSMAKDVRLSRRTESDFLAGMAQSYPGFPILKALHKKISAS